MGLFDRYLRIRIISAEPENVLSELSHCGVELSDVVPIDLLTVEMKIKQGQLAFIQKILHRKGSTVKITQKEGFLWHMQEILKRPVFVVGIALFLFAACFVPGRIFFVCVSGNVTIPDQLILAHAESCGIKFAAKASDVRSESAKNQLLGRLPELQWLGITTSGTVANIQVKERSAMGDTPDREMRVSSIIAVRDGVITEMTVHSGNPLFVAGQSVKEGDILVSGYTDCGIKLKAEQADAEIFAYTLHQNRFVSPLPSAVRGTNTGKHTCYKFKIGKKVINLCNHSGISDATCVKMYSEDYWTLPGSFQLPVSLIKLDYLIYDGLKPGKQDMESYQWMPEFALEYLQTQMIAGKVLNESLQWELSDKVCVLTGEYACHEMIGQVKYEEIIEQNAEDN